MSQTSYLIKVVANLSNTDGLIESIRTHLAIPIHILLATIREALIINIH